MTQIQVYLDLGGTDARVGTLYATLRRGKLTSVFAYGLDFIERPGAYAIDPALPLAAGTWPAAAALPRAVSDAAPDRWGRMLITKREAAEARAEGRAPRGLDEADFLLGAADLTRQGGLRFALKPGGPFVHPEPEVPRLVELPGLLEAADRAGEPGAGTEAEAEAAVKRLLGAGSASLGGARPKAAVRDGGRLALAKFPHGADEWDVTAWEATALDLAGAAGLSVPVTRLTRVGERSVLLSQRFDRAGGARLGYMSALTLIQADDAVQADYLDVAQALARVSAQPTRDLAELWRRVAFNIAVHNTDDHLRNLGLLRVVGGWRLSPAFDINPDPDQATARTTAIGGATGAEDSAQALAQFAEVFGLSPRQAREQAARMAQALGRWSVLAQRNGIDPAGRQRFAPVFQVGAELLATNLSSA